MPFNFPGRFIKTTVILSGSGVNLTPQPETKWLYIKLLSGGGGGGGAGAAGAGNGAVGGGGSSGAYLEVLVPAIGKRNVAFNIGVGGPGGTAGGDGSSGNITDFTTNGVTYSTPSSGGGKGKTAAAGEVFALGGSLGVAPLNGLFNRGRTHGGYGRILALGVAGCSGNGTESVFGGGAPGRNTSGNGSNGVGLGCGGAGGLALSGAGAGDGGAGSTGCAIIEEYA